jgi:hypothetical protein
MIDPAMFGLIRNGVKNQKRETMKRFTLVGLLLLLATFASATCSSGGVFTLNSAPGESNQASLTHTPVSGCTSYIEYIGAQAVNASSGFVTPALEVTGSSTDWFYMGVPAGGFDNITVPYAPNSVAGYVLNGAGSGFTVKFYAAITDVYESITVIGYDGN